MSATDSLWSRHAERIGRIHTLSRVCGSALSHEYLYSCDVRALPVLLEEMETRLRQGIRRRWWRLWR